MLNRANWSITLVRQPTYERLYTQTQKANQELVKIREPCSFQDITGKRVNYVVNSIRYIGDRIQSILVANAFIDLL